MLKQVLSAVSAPLGGLPGTPGGKETLLKKVYWLALIWILVLSTAAMIFMFSDQDGASSTKTSDRIVYGLLRLLHPDYDVLPKTERNRLYRAYQYAVRKAAHFGEYALFGASLRLLFHALNRRRPSWWAWGTGTLYACTDELHQLLISSRSARWQDVCIDSAGVLTGVLIMALILFLRGRRIKRTEA